METRTLSLDTRDGPMPLYEAEPEGGPKGAVVVIQEAFGVNPHIEDVTRRFASAGYRVPPLPRGSPADEAGGGPAERNQHPRDAGSLHSDRGGLQTKPTQHSVKEMRWIGIQPDVLLCRTQMPLSDAVKAKIALFSNVAVEAVIGAMDVGCIYEVLLALHEEGLDELIAERLNIWSRWPISPTGSGSWQV